MILYEPDEALLLDLGIIYVRHNQLILRSQDVIHLAVHFSHTYDPDDPPLSIRDRTPLECKKVWANIAEKLQKETAENLFLLARGIYTWQMHEDMMQSIMPEKKRRKKWK